MSDFRIGPIHGIGREIDHFYACIATDMNGSGDGIVSYMHVEPTSPPIWMPIVGAKLENVRRMTAKVARTARRDGVKLRIAKFVMTEIVEELR